MNVKYIYSYICHLCEAHSFRRRYLRPARKKACLVLWNLNVHCRVYNSPQINSVLNQMDQVQISIIFFPWLQIGNTIHSSPRTPMWYLLLFQKRVWKIFFWALIRRLDSFNLLWWPSNCLRLSSCNFRPQCVVPNIENRLRTKTASCVRRTESSYTREVLYSKTPVFKKYEKKIVQHFTKTVKENITLWKSGTDWCWHVSIQLLHYTINLNRLWPLTYWDRGFESHQGHGYLSVVSVVCCQVEVSATSLSLVQSSPTDCAASLCVI
jgi:hypothetical protein